MKDKNNKKEFPEEEELVIGTVKKIIGTSVFIKLEDYDKEGVMSFSEVAPGRIRNIRDYVAPNKKIVCQVLRINKEKGHIDLSLRRVRVKDQKEKLSVYNKEKSNLVIFKLVNKDEKLIEKIKQEYITLINFFEELIKNKSVAEKFLSKDETEKLFKLIKEKEKQKKIKVTLKMKIEHEGPRGVEIIKNILIKDKDNANIKYITAPFYSLTLENKDYKEANKKIEEIVEKIVKDIKSEGGKAEIIEK